MRTLKTENQALFEIVKTACFDLGRRMKQCKEAAQKPNSMADLGWSDKSHEAYWMREYYDAQYRFEKITRRFCKVKGA